MPPSEFRTRVAGWEGPCHPGSAVHDHACAPLYPTFSHNATQIPRSLPHAPSSAPIRPDRPSPLGNGGASRHQRSCTPRCSAGEWAGACTFGSMPSGACARLAREVVAQGGAGADRSGSDGSVRGWGGPRRVVPKPVVRGCPGQRWSAVTSRGARATPTARELPPSPRTRRRAQRDCQVLGARSLLDKQSSLLVTHNQPKRPCGLWRFT